MEACSAQNAYSFAFPHISSPLFETITLIAKFTAQFMKIAFK